MMDGNTCIHKFTTYLRHETGVNLTTVKIPVGKRFITWEGSPGADKTCAQVCSPNLAVWPTRRPAWWMSRGPPCWIYVHTGEYIWKGQSIYYAFSHLYLQIAEMISILLTLASMKTRRIIHNVVNVSSTIYVSSGDKMTGWMDIPLMST